MPGPITSSPSKFTEQQSGLIPYEERIYEAPEGGDITRIAPNQNIKQAIRIADQAIHGMDYSKIYPTIFTQDWKSRSFKEEKFDKKYGQTALNVLREQFPDNELYQQAISIDTSTGELVLPKFHESVIIATLRMHPEVGPRVQNMKDSELLGMVSAENSDISDMIMTAQADWDDVLGQAGQTFGRIHITAAQGLTAGWNATLGIADWFAWGIDKTVEAFGGDTGYRPLSEVKNMSSSQAGSTMFTLLAPDKWSKNMHQQFVEEHNAKMKYDLDYRAYNMWVENTPAWGNLGDSRVWGRIIGSTLPSLAATYGTGGVAFKGAKLLGLGKQLALKKGMQTAMITGASMEAGSYMENAVTYLSSDRVVSNDEFQNELSKFEKELMDEFHIKDDLTDNPSFKDSYKPGDEVSKPNMTLSEFNKRKQAYLAENFDFVGNEIYMKGMDVADAVDANNASALTYGIIAGTLEGLSASRVLKMLPDAWGQMTFIGTVRNKTLNKISSSMRRIPGANVFSRIPDKMFSRIVTQGGVESMEEVAQMTTEAIIASGLPLTAYKDKFDWSFDDAFESALGGFVAGGGIAGTVSAAQMTNIPDYYANKRAISERNKAPGREYYVRKDDSGLWNLYTSRDGVETQLKAGDGFYSGDKDSFTSFRAANKVAKRMRKDQRELEEKAALKFWEEKLINTEVGEITYNEDTEQYEVEIKSKETGQRVKLETFDSRVKAKKYQSDTRRNQKDAEEIKKKYTDEEIQEAEIIYTDPEAVKNQKTRKNTIFLKTYVSNIKLSKEEKELEEELEQEGAFNEDSLLDNMLDAINDTEALNDSGIDSQVLVDEIRQDYGNDVANQVADKLLEGPPTQEGPPVEEGPPAQKGPTKTPVIDKAKLQDTKEKLTSELAEIKQRAADKNLKKGDSARADAIKKEIADIDAKLEAKRKGKKIVSKGKPTPADQRPPESKAKKVSEMNLAEMKQALKEAEAKDETAMVKMRKKRLRKEIAKKTKEADKDKDKKASKKTVINLAKKDFKDRLSKYKDKQLKQVLDNIYLDKDDVMQDVESIDASILKKAIDDVSGQQFKTDEWVREAIGKLTEVYNLVLAQEDAQKETKKEVSKEVPEVSNKEALTFLLALFNNPKLGYKGSKQLYFMEDGTEEGGTFDGLAEDGKIRIAKAQGKGIAEVTISQISEYYNKISPGSLQKRLSQEFQDPATKKTWLDVLLEQRDEDKASDMEEMLKAAAEGTSKPVEGAEDTISPGNYDNINLVSPHIRKLEEEVPEGTIFLDDKTRVRVNRLNTPATDDYKDIIFTLNALKSGNPVSTIPMRADDGSSHDSAVLALNQALQAFDRKDYYDAAEKIDKIINDDTVLKFLDDEKYGMAAEKKALYNELTALKQAMGKGPSQRYQEAVEQTNRDAKRKEEVKETIKSIQNAIKDKVLVNGKQIKFKYVDKPEVDKRGWYDKGVVTINLAYADSTTLFHEVMHPFAESLYVNNKELFDTIYNHLLTDDIGKKVRKDHITPKDKGGLGMDESDPLTKVEILVEAIAIAALAKKPKKTGGIAQAIRRFFKWLKSIFFPKAAHKKEYQITEKTTFKDIADMLTNYQAEDFIPVDYNKDVQAVFEKIEGVARFQPMEPSKATKREANHLFEGAWKDVQKILKKNNLKADPFDFSTSMMNSIPSGVLRDYFNDWFYSKFEDHPDLKIRKKSKGENSGFIAEPQDVQSHVTEIFNDEAIREGLDTLIEESGHDERDVGINEQIWMEELNIYLREGQLANLKRKAKKTDSFESFAEQILPQYTLRRFDSFTNRQKSQTKRFYYRINSYIRTNQPEGKGNERDSYVVKRNLSTGKFDIILKDGEHIITGNQNPYGEKTTLHEHNIKKGVISWVSSKDYYEVETKRDKQGRDYQDIQNPYGFLDSEAINELNDEANRMNLTVVFSRGESSKIGLARITDTHKDQAKNIEDYVNKEVKAGYVPNKKDNKEAFLTAADIAAHEAMKSIWPKYLFDSKGAANNMKRIKIPLTPITVSKDMPDFNFKIFDPNKASFVDTDTGNVTDAVQNIRGVGRKYIMDGGTLGSRDLFNRLVQYGGVMEGSGSSKNVVYHVEGMSTLMVKHEMNRVPRNIEIWYNKGQAGEQLVAKVDNSGNITDAEGNPLDLLMTPDEAKVYDGYDIDAVHTVPGQSIGFIGYRDKSSKTSTHGLQWYSYVNNPEILQSFKDNILPKVNTQLAEIWNYSVDTSTLSADKIKKLLVDVLEHTDNEGYRHTMTEHAKLGAGLHQGLEPMLDQIIQNKRMNKTIRVGYQPGSRLKITGNLRGDLNENEIAIGKQDARVVYEAYSKAHDNMSIEDVKKEGISKINKWLEKNEVNVTTVRYPVPHEGGLILTRVKRLHNRKGLIEMHPVDVFAKLEGDMDGDEVQIERLAPEHEALVKDYVRKLNIKGINLSSYVPKKRDRVIFTDQTARFELMDALFYGETAIGEIANLMNVLGQISQVLDHAIIDGRKIVIRGLDEIVNTGIFKGKNMKVRDVLRTYLQAALDNVEFMLLKDWNYQIQNLYAAIFKRADGKPFRVQEFFDGMGGAKQVYQGQRVYGALKPLIDTHKKAGHIRKGFDFENGKYKLSDTVRESNDFLNYTNNREAYIHAKYMDHLNSAFDNSKIGHLTGLVFKEDALTSPWEDIASAPGRTMREHIIKHERRGVEDTVFKLNDLLHQNAHLDAVDFLNKNQSELLEIAYEQDVKNGIAVGDKATYLKAESRKAGVYRTTMGNSWFQALMKVDKMGSQTIDRNAKVVEMTNKYDPLFKDLSKSAKVMATIGFLKGFANLTNNMAGKKYNKFGKVRVIRAVPPASRSKNELQLLDESVLSKYYKEYNKIVSKPENRSLQKESKQRNYTSMEESIRRICY